MIPGSAIPELRFARFQGADIGTQLEALGRLRIAVFRAFPYLYQGDLAYEMSYLQTYVDAPRSLLFAAYERAEMIGATTCIPLADETADVQEPFLQAGMDIGKIFYFGESILLPAYRGHGLGHRFFDEREAHARSFGDYALTCFCAVDRPMDHPLRPSDYRPLDGFWEQRGYRKASHLQSSFEWLDIAESHPSKKTLTFWTREL